MDILNSFLVFFFILPTFKVAYMNIFSVSDFPFSTSLLKLRSVHTLQGFKVRTGLLCNLTLLQILLHVLLF